MGRASAQAPRAGPHKVYAQTRALSSRTGAFCAQNGGLRGAAGRLCRQGDEGAWTRAHGQVHVRSRFGNALLRRGRWAYPWICSGSAPFAARVRAPAVHAPATPCSAARALTGYAPWHDGLASAHTPRAIKRLSSRALAALPAARALARERFALIGTPPPLLCARPITRPFVPRQCLLPRRLGTQMRRTYPSAAPFICLCSFSRTRGRCARGPRPPARSS